MDATEEDRETYRARLGLDKPIFVQYFIFLGQAVRGEFGESWRWNRSAMSLILERMPATLELTAVGLLFSLAVALPVGVFSARKPGGVIDTFGKGLALLGQAMPTFWVGLLLMWLLSVQLRWLPTGGRGSFHQLIMPAITLGWFSMAALTRLTRSSMLDVLGSDYISVARAKGAPEYLITWKHALRNAAIPVVTLLGLRVAALLGGTIIIETVFAWPGVGRTLIEAIFSRDYNVVQSGAFMMSLIFVASNLIVDLTYGIINPRVRYQ
jgi:peptide/nickel transport system permease protein